MKAYDIVEQFENRVAEHFGKQHGVAVDCCTHAIFLSLKYRQHCDYTYEYAAIPARTYISVPFALMQAGITPCFHDQPWHVIGYYDIYPWDIVDAAKAWNRKLPFDALTLHCISFHAKKHIPIGRGGMIVTDDSTAADWLRRARYDGRVGVHYPNERIREMGWHMYMTPEQAARGMHLMDLWPNGVNVQPEDYPDLRDMPVFKGRV